LIALIAAMSRNRIIGKDNRLPWRLPADLARFKTITFGHTVVMGRKTFESIEHPLPGRKNIILTTSPHLKSEGFQIASSVTEILNQATSKTIYIIGGASTYQQFLPFAQLSYLTMIEANFPGDTFFPELGPNWRLISQIPGVQNHQNPYPHCFLVYQNFHHSGLTVLT
jgi:dihydrofolate reductase